MARKHRFSIVVMLGAAVVAGFFALSRSVQLGAASKPASTAQVSARARSLDRLEAQLRHQLAALPKAAPEGAAGRDPIRVARCPVRPFDRFARLGLHGDDGEHSDEGHEHEALGEAGGDD